MSIVVNEKQFQDDLEGDEVLKDLSQENLEGTSEDASEDLENEITNTIPDKFKEKSLEDVVNSYTELEKELGRKNNEVGELRKLADGFLKQQLDEPTPKESKIDLDDLLENPNDVITKSIDDNPRIAALEKELQQAKIEKQKDYFDKRHPDAEQLLGNTDFQNWVTSSPVRHNLFTQANAGFDYQTLDEIFNLYGELRGASKEQAEKKAATKRKEELRDVSVDKGSTGEVTKKIYRRADLIRLKQTNPSRYSDMNEEIVLAYQEGRVR